MIITARRTSATTQAVEMTVKATDRCLSSGEDLPYIRCSEVIPSYPGAQTPPKNISKNTSIWDSYHDRFFLMPLKLFFCNFSATISLLKSPYIIIPYYLRVIGV